MKALIFFAFSIVGTIMVPHPLRAQEKKATVLLTNISLEEALTILSISYDVQFSYNDESIPLATIINLNIQDETLDAALSKLLQPHQVTFKKTNRSRIILKRSIASLVQTIRGTITDAVTGVPIPGASVILAGVNPVKGTVTDDGGNFRLENVPVGRISIQVTSVGFDRHDINELLLSSGKELVIDVKLRESIVSMDEVVVSAAKFDGIPGDGVALTSGRTFSVEDTKRYAGSLGDPARMASSFAGVTGADDNNALVIRGNSPRGLLWRVDGIEIPNPNHFATEGSAHGVVGILSANVIGNSDFLTGAFPAQYGNALSGVFDIKLRQGNSERQEYAVQAGVLGLEVSAEGPFTQRHEGSYLVNYRFSTLSILDKLGVGLNEVGQYRDYQDLTFKLQFPTRAGNFSLFGIGGKSEANLTDTTLFDNNRSDIGTLGLTYRKVLGNNTVINGALAFSGTAITKNSELETENIGFWAVTEKYTKTFLRFSLSARRKITTKSYIEGGVTLSRLHYNFFLRNMDSGNQSYPIVVNFQELGNSGIAQGFLYNRQYLAPHLFAFYGVHFLHFSLSGDNSAEPRAGVRWQINDQHALSLGVGKHSRIENLQYYLARDHQQGGSEVQINKKIGFTRSNQLVVTHAAAKAGYQLKTELYHQWLYNAPVQANGQSLYTSLNEDTGFITDTLVNTGSGRNYGFEVSFEKPLSHGLYYLLNGTVYQSLFSIDQMPERSSAYNGNFALHALGGKEFDLSHQRKLGVNMKTTYAGGKPYVPIDLNKSITENEQVLDWANAFKHRFDNYFRTDLQLVYRTNRYRYSTEWRLDIQNITHHRNPAFYYFDKELKRVRLKNQVGILPLISYRIEF